MRTPHAVRRFVLVLLLGAPLLQCASRPAGAAAYPLPGPQLEEVPGPVLSQEGIPAPATWPALRYEQPLRILAITSKGNSAAAYQRIARRMRASLDLRYLGGGDDIYHVNDKWIEPKDNPTAQELREYTVKVIRDTVSAAAAEPRYEVIFCDNPGQILADAQLQEGLLACARQGTVLVVCANYYPAEGSPLAPLWPGKAEPRNSWMAGGARRTEAAEVAGLPLERLMGHTWIPLTSAAEGAVALATGESGACFLRRVDRGAVVFCPTGPISRRHDAIAAHGRRYDHDEIWLRLWDQVLYLLVRGEKAFPALTDLTAGETEAPPGQEYVLAGKVINRTFAGPLTLSVHVTTPRGKVVYSNTETVNLPAGQEAAREIRVPIRPEWAAGLYPVYLTLGEAKTKRQFHQSLQYIPVTGSLKLTLVADKRGYQTGETANLLLTATAAAPWQGRLLFGVYDFRGRLLAAEERPVTLGAEPQDLTFTYRMSDHGVRDDTFWAEVAAVRDGQEWERAEAKFYRYDRWSMRNEYQWSTWSGVACAAPSLVPMGMRMMAHAGMNAFGYPGRSELYYPAERWSWRYYNEGVGMNTWGPVIEYENEAEIEAQLLKEAEKAPSNPDLTSAALVLASVGEEAGFKHGWGTRYYWEEPVAPEKACRAFQWYLKTKYPDLAALNAVWRTNYQTWDEVKLTEEFSGRSPALEADGWAHPKGSPLGAGVTAVSLAPYQDTADFYNWYYDQIVNTARRILREKINPVTLTMSSAPTIGSANYDVRLTGPSAWNESQSYSINTGPEPGFGLIWGHFDWSVMTENMFWGWLLTRSGHNNYWVDIPLMFNGDMSHTRASFAMRRWTHRLAGHERIILDSRPFVSEVGVLGHNGLGQDRTRLNMTDSVKVALQQSGFGFGEADPQDLRGYKALFVVGRQAISAAEAERLDEFVRGGGTLVFTSRFATQTELGMPQPVTPGAGLAEKWGLQTTPEIANIPQYHSNETLPFSLDGVDPTLAGAKMVGFKIFREQVKAEGWQQLAAYEDGTPALLTRTLGRGRLVYLNAIYQSHWYIQWVTPTGPERQGFYRLIEWLCGQAGARRNLRLEGNLNQVLHMAVQHFTDPTGQIQYAIVRTNGEVPWTNGTLRWLGPQTAAYDVLAGEVGQPTPLKGKEIALNLRPGDGKLLAFVPAPVQTIQVTAAPARVTLGSPLRVRVEILDRQGRPVAGEFPLELRVEGQGGRIRGLDRSFSLRSSGEYVVNTALNEPVGRWTITVTDGISGLSGKAQVEATGAPGAATAPGFLAWGWPSEVMEPMQVSAEEFVSRLRALADLYRRDLSDENWMVKQYLGYYYDYFPGTRHDLLRPLNDCNWPDYVQALREAVNGGATFILTGEDVGIDPATGLGTWPHHEGRQLEALSAALAGARWTLGTRDGDTVVARLGAGRVVLCRESIDAAGNTNPEMARWQQRWLAELRQATGGTESAVSVPAPNAEKLVRWWAGQEALTSGPRTVTWFGGNYREREFTLSPNRPLGETFAVVLPPTGELQEAQFSLLVEEGADPLQVDVGCDDVVDSEIEPAGGQAAPVKLTEEIRRYLGWRAKQGDLPYRDDSRWRVVPIRITSAGAAKVQVKDPIVTVQ